MNRVAIVTYANKTIYAVSVFDDSGLTNLLYAEPEKTFKSGYEMYKFVLKLLDQNELRVKHEILFNCKLYHIVWCDVKNPRNHDQFFFTKQTALGERFTP